MQRQSTMVKVTSVVLALLLVISAFVVPMSSAFAAPTNEEGLDYALNKSASAAAIYVDNLFSAKHEGSINQSTVKNTSELTAANAGGGIGFIDEDYANDKLQKQYSYSWLSQPDSDAARVFSYAGFETKVTDGRDPGNRNKVREAFDGYARYGYGLKQIGFDNTTNNTGDFMRTMSGWALYVGWWIASGSDSIVNWCYDALGKLNPFAFFAGSTETDMGDYKMADQIFIGAAGGDAIDNSSGSLQKVISDLFDWGAKIGKYIAVPFFFAMFIFMLLFGKTAFGTRLNLSRARNLLVRAVFIVLGVPMLAWAYFGALQSVAGAMGDPENSNYANDVDYAVIGSLIDFQGWAETNNLNLPKGTQLNFVKDTGSDGGTVRYGIDSDTQKNLREIAVKVNMLANSELRNQYGEDAAGNPVDPDITNDKDGLDYGLTIPGDVSNGFWQSDATATGTGGGDSDYTKRHKIASHLMERYRDGATYTSSAYESYIKALFSTDSKTSDDKGNDVMREWVAATSDPRNYARGFTSSDIMSEEKWTDDLDNGIFTGGGIDNSTRYGSNGKTTADKVQELYDRLHSDSDPMTIEDFAKEVKALLEEEDDKLGDLKDLDKVMWFSDGKLKASISNWGSSNQSIKYEGGSNNKQKGLSTMSMFNYLNTDFTDAGLYLYSQTATNKYSKMDHYAVNVFGNGVYGTLVYANALALFLAIGVLALVYGLGMLIANVKRGFQVIVNTPLAMLGHMKSIARVVLMSVCMLVEIFAIAVLYTFMRSLLLTMNTWMTNLGPSLMSGLGISSTGEWASIASLALGTLGLILFIVLAIKARKFVLGGLSDLVSELVERVIGVKDADVADSNVAGSLAKGAMMGAAVARGGGLAGAAAGGSAIAVGATMVGGAGAGGAGGAGGDATSASDSTSDSSAEQAGGTDDKKNQPTASAIEGYNRQSGLALGNQHTASYSGDDAYNADVNAEGGIGEGGIGQGVGADASAEGDWMSHEQRDQFEAEMAARGISGDEKDAVEGRLHAMSHGGAGADGGDGLGIGQGADGGEGSAENAFGYNDPNQAKFSLASMPLDEQGSHDKFAQSNLDAAGMDAAEAGNRGDDIAIEGDSPYLDGVGDSVRATADAYGGEAGDVDGLYENDMASEMASEQALEADANMGDVMGASADAVAENYDSSTDTLNAQAGESYAEMGDVSVDADANTGDMSAYGVGDAVRETQGGEGGIGGAGGLGGSGQTIEGSQRELEQERSMGLATGDRGFAPAGGAQGGSAIEGGDSQKIAVDNDGQTMHTGDGRGGSNVQNSRSVKTVKPISRTTGTAGAAARFSKFATSVSSTGGGGAMLSNRPGVVTEASSEVPHTQRTVDTFGPSTNA